MRADDDDDVRDLFTQANPDAGPRLTVTAAEVAARGRRVHRHRRQLAAVGSTVAVVAVAAVLTATLARPQITPARPAGPTQVPITHTVPKPPPTVDHHAGDVTPPPMTTAALPTTTLPATSTTLPATSTTAPGLPTP
jgi:hypothetical protein